MLSNLTKGKFPPLISSKKVSNPILNAFSQFLTEEMDKLAERIVMTGQNREAAARHPGLNAWFPDTVTRVIENIY